MNVCFVSPEYFPISGGTGAYVYYLSRELQKRGFNVHIITRRESSSTEIVNGVNVNYIKCEENPLSKYWGFAHSTFKKLEELNKKFAFDIIHTNLPLVPNFAIPEESAKALISTVHSTWKGEGEAIKHEGLRRLKNRNVNDPDIRKAKLYSQSKVKMESFLKKYKMPYLAIDTTYLTRDQVVETLIESLPEQLIKIIRSENK